MEQLLVCKRVSPMNYNWNVMVADDNKEKKR